MPASAQSVAVCDGSRSVFRLLLRGPLVLTLFATSSTVGDVQTTSPLAQCEKLIAARPTERESARCFRRAANTELRPEIVRRFDELRREHPEVPWLPYYLAAVEWSQRTARVPALFAEAAQILNRRGDVAGEIDARQGRARFLTLVGRIDDADQEFQRLMALSELTKDPELKARIRVEQAGHLIFQGGDLEQALYFLLRDRQLIMETDKVSDYLKSSWLKQVYSAFYELGRYREAEDYLKDLMVITEDPFYRAAVTYNLAMLYVAGRLPDTATRELVQESAEQALELALQSGNLSTEILARRLLGQLLAVEEGRRHLEICLDLTENRIQEPGLQAACLEVLALIEATSVQPVLEKVEKLLQEATRLARDAGDPWSQLSVRQARARAQWALDNRDAGLAEGLEILDEVETLRSAQAAESGRARVLSVWWEPYQWLAGQLLRTDRDQPRRKDLALAFQVTERMRARTLLENLGADVVEPRLPPTLAAQLENLRKTRVKLQKRLVSPDLEKPERQHLKDELTTLEEADAALRHRTAMIHSHASQRGPRAFADLRAVENNLADDEAMLSFQFGLWKDSLQPARHWLLGHCVHPSR